jgi:hypothetical protein
MNIIITLDISDFVMPEALLARFLGEGAVVTPPPYPTPSLFPPPPSLFTPSPHELKINRLDFCLFPLKLKGISGAQSQHTQ